MRYIVVAACAAALTIHLNVASAVTIWAIDQHDMLFSFESSNPSVISNARFIFSDFSGDGVAIDFRRSDGRLYMLNAGGRLETISLTPSPNAGVYSTSDAGPVVGLEGTSHGFDFDPVSDRLRIVSDSDRNLSRSFSGGTGTVTEATLSAPYGNPTIVGAAYSNNFDGTTNTTLYTIDAGIDSLNIQAPASAGVQSIVGPLGIDVRTEEVGFDIAPDGNVAYLVANPAGTRDSNLYTVNISTGQATLIGMIGHGLLVRDIAVVIPEPSVLWVILGIAATRVRRGR